MVLRPDCHQASVLVCAEPVIIALQAQHRPLQNDVAMESLLLKIIIARPVLLDQQEYQLVDTQLQKTETSTPVHPLEGVVQVTLVPTEPVLFRSFTTPVQVALRPSILMKMQLVPHLLEPSPLRLVCLFHIL